MWAPDQFMEGLYEQTLSKTKQEFNDNWKSSFKKQLSTALGEFPLTQDGFDVRVLEEIEFTDFRRMRVELTTFTGLKLPAYILLPRAKGNVKRPAVLALHGHGYGSKEIVGLNPDGTNNLNEAPGIHKNFAIELVKKGVVVVAPELIGFGERKLTRDQTANSINSCFTLASQLLLSGKTLVGLRVAECRRIIDYLNKLSEIDSKKIGIMGFSGGGLVAAFTSVLDERIKATVISGYTNTYKGSILNKAHCIDNYVPGLLKLAEMPELFGLIAPRPLFIEAGIDDALFPIKNVTFAVERLGEIYQSFNAKHKLSSHYFAGEHEVCGEKSYDWLIEELTR